jgi:hypothetical protein
VPGEVSTHVGALDLALFVAPSRQRPDYVIHQAAEVVIEKSGFLNSSIEISSEESGQSFARRTYVHCGPLK